MNNDLISREALKKAFEEVYPLSTNEMGGVVNKRIYDIIDNAPTVEPTFGLFKEMLCAECGKRPHGEWIKEPNGKTTDLYTCSVCKRSIMLCKGADLTKYPFCHCGADMREEAEE